MGYYTRLATDPQERAYRGYSDPVEQLRFRIEDLRQRLLDLGGCYDAAMLARARSEDFRWPCAGQDIEYVLPKHLNLDETLAALLLAENKLWCMGEPPVEDELPDPDQLHIWGFYSGRTLAKTIIAA